MSTRCFRHLAQAAALLIAAAPNSFADQASIRTYGETGLEIGQAYLLHHGPSCYAILPTHVVKEAGANAALLREGRPPLLGEIVGSTDLGEDFSVAEVRGAVTRTCGYAAGSVSRGVSSRVDQGGIATIRAVNGDGTVAQLAVTIIDDDGKHYLRVQPTNDANQLRKGQSGSLLMVGDIPIGMLLSVDARFGFGKVIRFDHALEKLDTHLYARTATDDAPGPPSAASPIPRVVSWTALASSPANRATNLVDSTTDLPWVAHADDWPVTVEFDFSGSEVVVSGIVLRADGVRLEQRPRQIEVLVNSSTASRRWRSVSGGDVRFAEDTAAITFGPQRARDIRLLFYGAVDGGQAMALSRVEFVSE